MDALLTMRREAARRRRIKLIPDVAVTLLLIVLCFYFLAPVVWLILASTKSVATPVYQFPALVRRKLSAVEQHGPRLDPATLRSSAFGLSASPVDSLWCGSPIRCSTLSPPLS